MSPCWSVCKLRDALLDCGELSTVERLLVLDAVKGALCACNERCDLGIDQILRVGRQRGEIP